MVSSDEVTVSLTAAMTAGSLVLNNSAKIALLDERDRLEEVPQQLVGSDIKWIQPQILICLLVGRHRVAFNKDEVIKPGRLTNKLILIVLHDTAFVNFMTTTLNFAITFEKENRESSAAKRIANILKDMMGSSFLA